MTLIAVLSGIGLAYGLQGHFAQNARAEPALTLTATHSVTIGPQRYAVPASLMTDPGQRRDGFAERLEMTLALPIDSQGKLSEVDITLMPRGRLRPSSALLDSVYLHQFGSTQFSGIPGLVGKPLDNGTGTQGEIVWYDPLRSSPFTVKCMMPIHVGAVNRTCMRVFALSDRNTAVVTFDNSALSNWRAFDETIERAIAMLRI